MSALRGRRALVTGASSGLGVAFATQLAALGCDLVLVARRQQRLEELADNLRNDHGVEARPMPCDLLADNALDDLMANLDGTPIDVLVNNAGLGIYGPFMETPWHKTARMIQLDVSVPMELTRILAARMLARGRGHVLQVASIAGYQPAPLYAAYAAAKAAVLGFSEALSYELRDTDVSCTVLCPGVTRTEFFDVAEQDLTLYQRVMMMEADDVARIGLRAMLKGRRCVIPGLLNKIGAWLSRALPRAITLPSAHLMMRPPS